MAIDSISENLAQLHITKAGRLHFSYAKMYPLVALHQTLNIIWDDDLNRTDEHESKKNPRTEGINRQ